MEDLNLGRQRYAELIQRNGRLRSQRLVRALADVPREKFLSPGPWKIFNPPGIPEYQQTADDDPIHIYQDVLVALDPARQLNNGLPSFLCQWIDALDLVEGECVLHAGCGTGYYTALMAHVVGPSGRVIAIEFDRTLAERATRNLVGYPWVEVICGDATTYDAGPADGVLINAGATHPLPLWLDSLRPGARMVLPLTRSSASPAPIGLGVMIKIRRLNSMYEARVFSPVAIFLCAGASDAEADRRLGAALNEGGFAGIRSLRRDTHDRDESCGLHGEGYCFSRQGISASLL